jgi:dethiobiotin synthetase
VRGCFVTGTDTGVGKTVLAAAIAAALHARGVRVAAFKPVVTGIDEPEPGRPADHELLGAVTGLAPSAVAPLRFGPAVSPHLAAELAGTAIEPAGLIAAAARAGATSEALVVEGVGGLLVPISVDFSIRDLAVALGLPVVVAARPGLGTISHTLLTVEAARAAGLDVRAVVLTPWPETPSVMEASNRDTIARLARVEVATLPPVSTAVDELAAAGATLALDAWLGDAGGSPVTLVPDVVAGAAKAGAPTVVPSGPPTAVAAGATAAGQAAAGAAAPGQVAADPGAAAAAPEGRMPLAGPELRGERVVLRAITAADVAPLAAIFATPEVGRWWPEETQETMRERVTEGEPDTTSWAVWDGDDIVGLAQGWEEREPMYRHGGIDLSLHPGWHGRGLGSDTVRAIARWLFDERGHHRITIDPAAHNAVAIRCYERVGFRPVGVMRRYERGPDGTWHDGLLMDLLQGELR